MELEVAIEWNQIGVMRLSFSFFLDEDLLARFASVAQCKQEVVLDCLQWRDWRMPPSSGGDSGSRACGPHLVHLALPIWWAFPSSLTLNIFSCVNDGEICQDFSLLRNFPVDSMCLNFLVCRSAFTSGGEAVEVVGASTGPFSEQPHHGGTPLMSLAPYDSGPFVFNFPRRHYFFVEMASPFQLQLGCEIVYWWSLGNLISLAPSKALSQNVYWLAGQNMCPGISMMWRMECCYWY